jgi:type II secretory pathway pseudopilin PulG
MLTVIVIIGILASLITAAVIHARAGVKVFTVRKEINDLQQALEAYKIKYGEYPPDFAFQMPAAINPNSDLAKIRRRAVMAHLQSAFPRYFETLPATPPDPDLSRWNAFRATLIANYNNSNLDLNSFDHATSLVFWLGGLPEQVPAAGDKWIPAGFHADKANPFRPGLPRTEPFFTFNADRLRAVEPHPDNPADPAMARLLRYYPPDINAPYVYFRARRDAGTGRFEYGATIPGSTNPPVPFAYFHASGNVCLPYMNGIPSLSDPRPCCEPQKFQIIAAGMSDNCFGADPQISFIGRNLTTGDNITNADFDNITSFADGKLEDAMPK